jgi:signal transduction histidine kinase
MSLREGALVVFSLVAVVPILLFIYLLSSAEILHRTDVQVGLVLAIVVSGLGFVVFRRMVGQIARLADGFQGVRTSAPTPASPDAAVAEVPGLGQVTEIGQVTGAFYQMLEDLRGATQRLEDLVFKLGTLNETVDLAARIPQIQNLLGKVLQTTMRAVHATGGSIMILDRERQFLSQAASRGALEEPAPVAPIKLGEGLAGKVVERGEPVLVDDVEADPRFREPGAPPIGRGSFLCMPIRAGERVIGVINMMKHGAAQDERAQPFSATDLQFLNALMTYIGYAVDNARLLEEAQQSARRLQTVVDDLKTTQEQLVRGETLRALGQLSSGMTHHLNNLFAVIQGRAELLLGGTAAAGSRRSLEIIRRAAQDGADVARRVQRFSRLQPIAEPVAADLNRLVLDVVALTEPRWKDPDGSRAQEIAVEVQTGEVPPVVCEIAPLREALVNLLLNAADAMPDGGTITVRTGVDGGRVRCSVADTGVGMSEEVRRRALEPFFTTKGAKRTGLGLSVAYGAVQRYGGSLDIQSQPGLGTTVTLNLPIAVPAAVSETGSEAAAPGTGLRVLIIDDEAEARDVLAEILEEAGHCVVKTARGEEGLGRLRGGESFDVVLTDLLMPGMSGWDVARVLQQSFPRLPVGLVTAWSEQIMTAEERTRVDLVITKPFEPERVRETLAGLTRRAS